MIMYRISQLSLLVVCILAGCNSATAPPPAAKAMAVQPASPQEEQAIQLANTFLKTRKQQFGPAIGVQQHSAEVVPGMLGPSIYVVRYPTPPREIQLLGEREVIVDIDSERCEFAPRD